MGHEQRVMGVSGQDGAGPAVGVGKATGVVGEARDGAGLGRPMHAPFEPMSMEPVRGSNRGLLIGVGVGVLLIGFGVFRAVTGKDEVRARAPSSGVSGYLSEQQRLMRDAIEMARSAQELQRQHMERMRRDMMYGEFGSAGLVESDSGGD